MGTSWEIALRWMPQKLTNEKKASVQIIAWQHQAKVWASVYLELSRHMVSLGYDELKVNVIDCTG